MKNKTRPYSMKKRAKQVARNERKIMKAVTQLWKELPLREITLDKVADMADISVRTLIRKYGSKEELIEECIKNDAGKIEKRRNKAEVGNISDILIHLMDEYEEFGPAIVRTLTVEEDLDTAKNLLTEGRKYHKQWCEKVFSPYLPKKGTESFDEKLHAFIAATDLYIWKLIRLDLNKSKSTCMEVYRTLIMGLTQNQ